MGKVTREQMHIYKRKNKGLP